MTYGSLFSGIGGFDIGFDRAEMKGLWQVENDKDCNRVLGKHWPDVWRHGDVKSFPHGRILVRPDVICGGFPCQDLSVAGQRKGLAGKRSGLWKEFHRVIAEFKPRFCVIENVPGLFPSNGGLDFLTIIRGLAELGYCVAWRVLDSQYFGVAQRRQRVFIIGSLGNGSCAQILFESESVRGDTAPGRETRERIAGTLGSRTEKGGMRTTDLDGHGAYIADCLQERDSKGSDSNTKRGHLIPILEVGARTGRNYREMQDGDGIGKDGDPMFSLQSRKQHAVACFDERSVTCPDNRQSADAERCQTLNGGQGMSVAQVQWASGGGRTENDSAQSLRSAAEHNYQFARVGASVRRLTPVECERLQGFPDDWTRYDAQDKEISDSARYRMLGNAVTVSVAEWIGKRILAQTALMK